MLCFRRLWECWDLSGLPDRKGLKSLKVAVLGQSQGASNPRPWLLRGSTGRWQEHLQ